MPPRAASGTPVTSWIVGLTALAATGAHVVATHYTLAPIDLGGFIVSSLAFVFHRVPEISFGLSGLGNVSVKQQLERTERVAQTAIANRGAETDATSQRLDELHRLQALVQRPEVTDDYALEAVLRFINSRLEDLAGWVAEEREDVRAALWWWSAEAGGLRIVAAPQIIDAETLNYVFKPGSGILGRVYLEPRPWNVPDAPTLSEWVRVAAAPPRYHGLLCLPVELGGVVGVLTVDRTQAVAFDDDSIEFAKQTVLLISLAIATPRAQAAFRSVDALPRAASGEPPSSTSPGEPAPAG